MRKSVQDPYCLITDPEILRQALTTRTRWKYASIMVVAITANPQVRAAANCLVRLIGF